VTARVTVADHDGRVPTNSWEEAAHARDPRDSRPRFCPPKSFARRTGAPWSAHRGSLLDGYGPAPDWLTLGEAGDGVTITEVDEAGDVPTLRITNEAGRPVLLLDGEELIGAKRNRILNTWNGEPS
jgi:hypothetical protein